MPWTDNCQGFLALGLRSFLFLFYLFFSCLVSCDANTLDTLWTHDVEIYKSSRLGGSRSYLRDSPVPDFNYFHVLLLILHTCPVMHVHELIVTTSTLYS